MSFHVLRKFKPFPKVQLGIKGTSEGRSVHFLGECSLLVYEVVGQEGGPFQSFVEPMMY
jgi:hypothetical protein